MPHRGDLSRDAVYLELVRSLFRNSLPSTIMSAIFALSFVLINERTDDVLLFVLGWLGIAASIVRLVVVACLRARVLGSPMTPTRVRRDELIFAIAYLSFGLCLGLYGGRVFMLPLPGAHTLTVALLIGYCAGVSTVAGLRPFIAIPSMICALAPAVLIAILRDDSLYQGLAVVAIALLLGGSQSMLVRAQTVTFDIRQRITFASLARHDGLTGLANRLALREHFEEQIASRSSLLAVHYLDLDHFKPVNDRFGHPTGDALLIAVAGRLKNLLRNRDLVARIGGDEFAILQCDITSSEEASALAGRLVAALARPFRINEHTVEISASVGTAVTHDHASDLDTLLERADHALYQAKPRGTPRDPGKLQSATS